MGGGRRAGRDEDGLGSLRRWISRLTDRLRDVVQQLHSPFVIASKELS